MYVPAVVEKVFRQYGNENMLPVERKHQKVAGMRRGRQGTQVGRGELRVRRRGSC